ncbi:Na+/H+ antiporter subunit E [Rhizobiaceae bacterium n13]|uniref:Na+/H+ antiporter subunit E n=1 Tax=Ferirhizobium litorale TaxID=2927786 RepID=A0AAE3QDB0_9HYPH|nr:Na+/H+ antiporter subunit E [Fererhizobium litorale]MDI7861293.1 Na+/H+ antiporter subunit E [Fererhizobium litorale]MDI7921440.1 Na+/H+ antiporter subunit E [Fererhizobium litorale]
MNLFLLNLLLAIAWVAVSGSISVHNFIFGFVLATLALILIREQVGGANYLTRTRRVLSLFILFVKELMNSAWKVAVTVCRPNMELKPGIIAVPLRVDRDFEITLLANLITLTPGTLSVDVSDDRRFLYVHALDCSDPVGLRRDIAEGFERKILEAFR